ncbi:MAG: hypothetical protein IK073_06765 [Paludibacteraceae bacterium]|nr:hypothetical protein [Paludibacteraceae bacterium]
MKKFFFALTLMTMAVCVHAQVIHYTYDRTINASNANDFGKLRYAKEYSIKLTANALQICDPAGKDLSNSFIHGDKSTSGMYATKTFYRSSNKAAYKGDETLSGFSGQFAAYEMPVQESYMMNNTFIDNNSMKYHKILVSKDRNTLVFVTPKITYVYRKISARTTTNNAPMVSSLTVNGYSYAAFDIDNSSVLINNPASAASLNAATTPPSTTSSSTQEVFVGNYTALGLSQNANGSVTYMHSQTYTIYRDNQGYYLYDSILGKYYLIANMQYTVYGHDVSGYNYRYSTTYSDIVWFLRIP